MNKIIMIGASSFSCGKDTVASKLREYYEKNGKRVRIIAFADWVKDSLKRWYGWDGKKDDAGRHLMQSYATDTVRAADPTYWAEVVARLCNATRNDWDIAIIPDLRFPNEHETMEKYFNNVFSIKVCRSNGYDSNNANRQHSSEHSVDDFNFDYIIDNSGTLEELYSNTYKIYNSIESM